MAVASLKVVLVILEEPLNIGSCKMESPNNVSKWAEAVFSAASL